jgi:uncharacterized protein (DUF2141 family)
MRLLLATAGAALLLAAPAQAAYAPKVQVTLDTTMPEATPAVTSVITQQPGETASKTVVVTFPKGFEPNLAAKATKCTPEQENAKACPPESRIGDAEATASVAGVPQQLTGGVFFGGPNARSQFRIIVQLHNDLLGDTKVIGTAELAPGGGVRTIFDNLPDVLTTSFKLALAGGEKSLLKNPLLCQDYDITGSFTSQKGETANSSQKVTIAGCKPAPLALNDLVLTARKVTFDITVPARLTVTVKRNKKRVASGTFTLAKAGTAKVTFPRLKPGRYVVAVTAKTDDGRTLTRRFHRTLR